MSERISAPALAWTLRIGIAMEFIGHGMLGIGGVAAWTSYFGVVGIPKDTALSLMPLVGMLDVALGLAVIIYPLRALLPYMAAWGLWTALLRPLAGESGWEAVERTGNYGVLLALLLMTEGGRFRSWFRFRLRPLDDRLRHRVAWVLRITTVLLLAGHGALGLLVHKRALAMQYSALGLTAPGLESIVGAAEIVLALAVLLWPAYGLLMVVLGWKIASELLAPLAHLPVWVFIEHGGSYAAPLALALLNRRPSTSAAPLPVHSS